jgi:hypothetical protein
MLGIISSRPWGRVGGGQGSGSSGAVRFHQQRHCLGALNGTSDRRHSCDITRRRSRPMAEEGRDGEDECGVGHGVGHVAPRYRRRWLPWL